MLTQQHHQYRDLIAIFEQCFLASHNTRLVKGGDEPIYIPANDEQPYHAIYFAHGYYSSALHEVSHWLVAGEQRRLLEDFGYWYVPDGRTEEQQRLFEQVEVKPQAIEWILSMAAGFRFYASADNLSGETGDTLPFKQAVYQQVMTYLRDGLPERAETLRQALCRFYDRPLQMEPDWFELERI